MVITGNGKIVRVTVVLGPSHPKVDVTFHVCVEATVFDTVGVKELPVNTTEFAALYHLMVPAVEVLNDGIVLPLQIV
jgi:hypothetical protein